MKTREEMAYAE